MWSGSGTKATWIDFIMAWVKNRTFHNVKPVLEGGACPMCSDSLKGTLRDQQQPQVFPQTPFRSAELRLDGLFYTKWSRALISFFKPAVTVSCLCCEKGLLCTSRGQHIYTTYLSTLDAGTAYVK